jgi:myo-inositol-1(or 4)-monophosphatase
LSGNRLQAELRAAREAAIAAGEIIARYAGRERETWQKEDESPVTIADLEANAAIERTIHAAFPDDAILSEETADSPGRMAADRLWIIDPLDGTKEFVAGIPEFAVSIALTRGGTPIVGVVYQPLTRECFWAVEGDGAHLGEQRTRVSSVTALEQSTMLSSRTEMKRGQIDGYKDWFADVRPIGSVAFKLALVSAGRGDLWISAAPKNEWDVCAGHLLVREAGGIFVTLDDGERSYNRRDTLLHPEMAAGPQELVEGFIRRRRAT